MATKVDNETKMVWPEHARLMEQKHKTEIIHEFLTWCEEKSIELCYFENGRLHGISVSSQSRIDKLLAEFIGVNLKELEREKRAMLSQMRATNEQAVRERSSSLTPQA